jgi:hypothetical protein
MVVPLKRTQFKAAKTVSTFMESQADPWQFLESKSGFAMTTKPQKKKTVFRNSITRCVFGGEAARISWLSHERIDETAAYTWRKNGR